MTCSSSALESTSIAFCPPVSAISGATGPSRAANARLIARAAPVLPVNATPAVFGCRTSASPTAASPVTRLSALTGIPAACMSLTASKAINGVSSAGFAITVLPAMRAAEICPAKMASGKFQGLMHTNTPRPCRLNSLDSPVGPGSRLGRVNSRFASVA